ncbi:MAG: hypothetical protein ABSA64_05340 [Sedimentisphaerales bacterium]|jgi:hypothetical protein
MQQKHLVQFIFRSLANTSGGLSLIGTIVFGVVGWFGITPDKEVSLRIPFLIILILLFLVWWIFRVAWMIYEQSGIKLPSVKQVTFYDGSKTPILILEPSPLFSYNSIVAIYYNEDEFEKLIGIGSIINIQRDGQIQVSIIETISEDKNLWNPILESNSKKIKYLLVKPNAPADLWRIKNDRN